MAVKLRPRLPRTAAVVAFILATTVVYAPVVSKLALDWWTEPDYSHGLLCAPLAVGLVFRRREFLAALPREPRAAGLFGAAVAMAALALGTLGAELFLTRVSLLLFIASSVVFLCGWQHLRTLAFPLALLLLSIPIPAIVITRITLPLQFAASTMTESALNVLNVPVLREGNVLALPNATLQVAEACSGIRSLVSLAVLALMVARFAERRTAARAAIVIAAVPTAVLVNGLRVTVTAVTTYWYGPAAAEGLVHEAVGCLTFLVALALLAGCARAVRSVGQQPAAAGAFP
jgi:exosortase